MKELIESILQKEYTKANELFSEQINSAVSRKLTEAKKMCAAKMSVKEQLNVNKKGNYEETGGKAVILSHEKQKRGLSESDVVSIGGDNLKSKYEPKSMESMKEEAKKAALSIVTKRKETSEERIKRFERALKSPGILNTPEKPKLVKK